LQHHAIWGSILGVWGQSGKLAKEHNPFFIPLYEPELV